MSNILGAPWVKVIIAGGRTFNDVEFFIECLKKTEFDIVEVVSGGADGADRLGEMFAREFGLKLTKFPADWHKFGRGAGPRRNRQMAEYADALICFDTGGPGSKNMIQEMRKRGKMVEVWESR